MAELLRFVRCIVPVMLVVGAGCARDVPPQESAERTAAPAKKSERHVELTYRFRVTGLPAGESVRVWFPRPREDEFQDVRQSSMSLPAPDEMHRGAVYGNEYVYFEAAANEKGELAGSAEYGITRREAVPRKNSEAKSVKDAPDFARDLAASKLVPLDGPPLALLPDLSGAQSATEKARLIFDAVDGHMRYDKSQPGYGHGDVVWACRSGFGNCTDFHSLFLSLCRSQGIPARFEIGFPLPPERGQGTIGGYHCWAWFYDENTGWTPVDISEADKHPDRREEYFGRLDVDRVGFSVGRDLTLEPPPVSPPLNYFIYPHVEVGGEAWPREKVELTVEYRDL